MSGTRLRDFKSRGPVPDTESHSLGVRYPTPRHCVRLKISKASHLAKSSWQYATFVLVAKIENRLGGEFHSALKFYFYLFSAAVQEILLETERNKQRAKDYGSLAW